MQDIKLYKGLMMKKILLIFSLLLVSSFAIAATNQVTAVTINSVPQDIFQENGLFKVHIDEMYGLDWWNTFLNAIGSGGKATVMGEVYVKDGSGNYSQLYCDLTSIPILGTLPQPFKRFSLTINDTAYCYLQDPRIKGYYDFHSNDSSYYNIISVTPTARQGNSMTLTITMYGDFLTQVSNLNSKKWLELDFSSTIADPAKPTNVTFDAIKNGLKIYAVDPESFANKPPNIWPISLETKSNASSNKIYAKTPDNTTQLYILINDASGNLLGKGTISDIKPTDLIELPAGAN